MAWIFGDFRLDPERFELFCGAELVRLEPQVLALLCLLVRHHDRMVTKDAAWFWPSELTFLLIFTSKNPILHANIPLPHA